VTIPQARRASAWLLCRRADCGGRGGRGNHRARLRSGRRDAGDAGDGGRDRRRSPHGRPRARDARRMPVPARLAPGRAATRPLLALGRPRRRAGRRNLVVRPDAHRAKQRTHHPGAGGERRSSALVDAVRGTVARPWSAVRGQSHRPTPGRERARSCGRGGRAARQPHTGAGRPRRRRRRRSRRPRQHGRAAYHNRGVARQGGARADDVGRLGRCGRRARPGGRRLGRQTPWSIPGCAAGLTEGPGPHWRFSRPVGCLWNS